MVTTRYFIFWLVLGWFIVVSIIYLSLTPTPPKIYDEFFQVDKLKHIFAYLVLMGWFTQLYQARITRLRYAFVFFILGVSMEVLQGLTQSRQFEYYDMLANGTGIVLALLLASRIKVNLFALFEKIILK